MRLTFSSEVCVILGDFAHNRLPVIISSLFQNRILLRVGGWRPYCVLKRCWTTVRDCNCATHNTHSTCSYGVDIVTELAEGHQLVHADKAWNKNFQSFPFWWHKLDIYMTISEIYIFYFGYLSSGHHVDVWGWGDFHLHNIHIEFRKSQSVGSRLKCWRETNTDVDTALLKISLSCRSTLFKVVIYCCFVQTTYRDKTVFFFDNTFWAHSS
jgi:hypothetical protein